MILVVEVVVTGAENAFFHVESLTKLLTRITRMDVDILGNKLCLYLSKLLVFCLGGLWWLDGLNLLNRIDCHLVFLTLTFFFCSTFRVIL